MSKSDKQLLNVLHNIVYSTVHADMYDMFAHTKAICDDKHVTSNSDFDFVHVVVGYNTEKLPYGERKFNLDINVIDCRYESVETSEILQVYNRQMTAYMPLNCPSTKTYNGLFSWAMSADTLTEIAEAVLTALKSTTVPDGYQSV